MSSEAEIQHAILLYLGSLTWLRVWRSNSGSLPDPRTGRWVQFNFKGCPDVTGILAPSGRYLGVEVKSLTGRQSPAQRDFQGICERFGGLYILARSVDDVRNALRAAGYESA